MTYDIAVCISVWVGPFMYIATGGFFHQGIVRLCQNEPNVPYLKYISNTMLLEYNIWDFGIHSIKSFNTKSKLGQFKGTV